MSKYFIKRIMITLVILVLGFNLFSGAVFGAAASDPRLKSYERVVENTRLALYANIKTGEIAVQDKDTGELWMSNPPDWSKDKIAFGQPKVVLQSQITVRYADSKNALFNSTSKLNSVNKKGLTSKKDKAGVTFTYDFAKEKLKVPVRYTLGPDFMRGEILTDKISEYGDKKIITITFLPYFGAAGTKDTGYMLVPDGSGALINFNNGKVGVEGYSQPVYGDDAAFEKAMVDTFTEDARLPVFGMKKNSSGFVAIIEKNEARAVINAAVSGKSTSYNTIYPEFEYRSMGTMVLPQKNWQSKDVAIVERMAAKDENFSVRYCFLKSGQSDYAGMSSVYRNYLMKEKKVAGSVKPGNIPFYADLYGYVKKKKPILGIPFTRVIPLTTFDDSIEIAGRLKDGGVDNVIIRFNGWQKNGFLQKIPVNAYIEGKLGGEKGYRKLSEYLAGNGGQLYLNSDLINVYSTGNSFSKFRDAAMSIVNVPVLQYRYLTNVYIQDNSSAPWYLLAPGKASKFADRFMNSFSRLGTPNLALGSLGRICYSDLGINGFGRWNVPAKWQEILGMAKSKTKNLMVDGGNAYTVPYADHIVMAPDSSSGFDIEDESVPFYQMVFHGLVNYSGSPTNLSSDPEKQKLKCLEMGSSPLYSWISRDNSELKDTLLDYLYSADYRDWISSAVKDYKEINGVLSGVAGQYIVSHTKISEGVYRTTYEKGLSITVNYNKTPVSVEGKTVDGLGYTVFKGEGR